MLIKTIPINQIKENDWNPNEVDEFEFSILVKNIKDKKIGYTQPYISLIETGKVKPSKRCVRALEEAINIAYILPS